MANAPELCDTSMQAKVDFACLDPECAATIEFNVMQLKESRGRLSCRECHREYQFDQEFLRKLEKFRALILALREAESILGEANVAVTTPNGEVKIPYRLLLTRLNTLISLEVAGKRVDFHFRVEPLQQDSIR